MFFSYFRPAWCICHVYHMAKNYCNNCGFLLVVVVLVQCLGLSTLLIPLVCLGKPHIKRKKTNKTHKTNKKNKQNE